MAVSIVGPKNMDKCRGQFNLRLASDMDLSGLPVTLYYNNNMHKIYPFSKKILVNDLPEGKLELYVAVHKGPEQIVKSKPITIKFIPLKTNNKKEVVCELCGFPPETCGCGGGHHSESSSESEQQDAELMCADCGLALKDCGCGKKPKHHHSRVRGTDEEGPDRRESEVELACSECGLALKDCGCGKKPKTHHHETFEQDGENEADLICSACKLPLTGCGCGKKPKTGKTFLSGAEQVSRVAIIHGSTRLPNHVEEAIIEADAEKDCTLTLASDAYVPVTISNFGSTPVNVVPGAGSYIKNFEDQWDTLELKATSTIILVPSGQGYWYLRNYK